MKDKLIETIRAVPIAGKTYEEYVAAVAEKLIDKGVSLPLYKVNTKVYTIDSQTSDSRNLYIFEDTITRYINCGDYTIMCFYNHIGIPQWNWKRVFLTREEAEQALKKYTEGEG